MTELIATLSLITLDFQLDFTDLLSRLSNRKLRFHQISLFVKNGSPSSATSPTREGRRGCPITHQQPF